MSAPTPGYSAKGMPKHPAGPSSHVANATMFWNARRAAKQVMYLMWSVGRVTLYRALAG